MPAVKDNFGCKFRHVRIVLLISNIFLKISLPGGLYNQQFLCQPWFCASVLLGLCQQIYVNKQPKTLVSFLPFLVKIKEKI